MLELFKVLLIFAYSGLLFIGGVLAGHHECQKLNDPNRTASSYKNCIVIDKKDNILVIDSCGRRVDLNATNYELSLYQLGDTIK